MAQLIVRNVDEKLVRRLKERAAKNGRSMEAEHRALLENSILRQNSDSREEWLAEVRKLRKRYSKAATGESTLEILRYYRDTR